MALRYYIFGEVTFSSSQKRNTAGRRLENRAAQAGFTAEVWRGLTEAYGTWPAGRGDVTVGGLAGLRFCYSSTDPAAVSTAFDDIAAAWDVFQDSDSWWSYAAEPIPA